MNEITLEITNFCEEKCKYCSSEAVSERFFEKRLNIEEVTEILRGKQFEVIHISGGEPLSHPDFYRILIICKKHSKDVVVHTNALTHIAFNGNVIDNIYIEEYLTVSPDVDEVHILKRVEQGKELNRPEVHFSGNWIKNCSCDNIVVKPDGKIGKRPCNKGE